MKTFLNSLRIVSVVAVLAVGVSYVFAWSEPTVNPPANTAAPIHTGDIVQKKQGGIWSENILVSPVSIFNKSMFLPGNKSVLRIGSDDTGSGTQSFTKGSAGAITQDFNTALFGETDSIPLVIDLHNRAQPRDAIEFKTDQACPIVTRFTNDKAAAFEFKKGTARANIIARQVRLTGGDPDANDVLVGDADGNARWAKASVNANGVVVFSSGTSPVPAGQTCQISPVICNDPAANNYNRVGACTYSSDPEGCYAYEIKSNCIGNAGGLGVVIPPSCTKTSTVGQTSCSTPNQGQEIYRIQCTSPITDTPGVGLPYDLPDGPIHFTNSNPISCPTPP
jgi:hypothetical protein